MIRAALWRVVLELWYGAARLYAQFLRWCVSATDAYIRSRVEDGITNTASLQAWTVRRDIEMRTIERLENLRDLNNWKRRP